MTVTVAPNPLEVLVALESPLLDGLAPELVDIRARASQAAAKLEGPSECSSCERGRVLRTLAVLAEELQGKLDADPALRSVFPSLMITAKQSMSHG